MMCPLLQHDDCITSTTSQEQTRASRVGREQHWIVKDMEKMKGLEICGLSRGWQANEESGRQRSRTGMSKLNESQF